MWIASEVAVLMNEMRFEPEIRAVGHARQLVVDGVQVCNAMEFVHWSTGDVHLEVCSYCGSEGCGSGGYASVRRAGDHAIFFPSFKRMDDDDDLRDYFTPPAVMRTRGTLWLGREQVEIVTQRDVGFPAFDGLRPITGREFLRVFQWEAPQAILGSYPSPVRLREEDVLAASAGELEVALGELRSQLAEFEHDEPVTFAPLADDAESVSLFLDGPRFEEWPAFVRDPCPGLLLGDSVALGL